jgi:serine-threonine kinase receptor-associated protein
MELSPQTNRLVVTSGVTVAFIPSLPNSGAGTHSLTLNYSPSSASIHPILQDRFVTGNLADEWVRVHGIDGEEKEILRGHHGPVHCVEFSPDGEMYASGSGKCSAFLLSLSVVDICYFRDYLEDGKLAPVAVANSNNIN